MRASVVDGETIGWGDDERFPAKDSISSSVGGRPTSANFSLRNKAADDAGAAGSSPFSRIFAMRKLSTGCAASDGTVGLCTGYQAQ